MDSGFNMLGQFQGASAPGQGALQGSYRTCLLIAPAAHIEAPGNALIREPSTVSVLQPRL